LGEAEHIVDRTVPVLLPVGAPPPEAPPAAPSNEEPQDG
jgi:hypothetical protein